MKKILFIFMLLTVIVFTGCGSNETFIIKEINLEMVKCPAGSFLRDNKVITIEKPFYIGKFEVTQKQYEDIMGNNPSHFKSKDNPVESVSLKDAKAFCNKLNIEYSNIVPQGYRFDLPSYIQWEYACRAGTKTDLNNGKNLTTKEFGKSCPNLDEVAWYSENSGKTTHEVGQKKPNTWGIYDMHGNVCELCVFEEEDDEYCGYQGGNYINRDLSQFQSDSRQLCVSGLKIDFIGFRVALVPVVQ